VSLGWDVTYGIRAITQPEMGERAQAHEGRWDGCQEWANLMRPPASRRSLGWMLRMG
jgi:hypothetical protein